MPMRLVRIFAQAWRLLKESPVLGTISILGTALAIGMVTITVAAKRLIPEGDFYPAFKRQRMLYYKYAVTESTDTTAAGGNYTAGRLGYPLASAIASVPAAEMATIHEVYTAGVEFLLPGEEDAEASQGRVRSVDIPFWQIYDFDFVHGTPFTPEEERSAARVIVLAQSLSQELFGSQDPVGREVLMQYIPYRVVGVVRDVSGYLTELAANAWIPLSIFHNAERDMDVHGDLQVDFLAASASDFPAIREQVLRKLQEFSTTLDGEEIVPYGQPEPLRAALARGGWMIEPPDLAHLNLIFYVTVLILLLVPGINLVALSYARMRRRLQELGVRRAFGATMTDLLKQIVGESLFFTLIGAALGVLLMVATAYLLKNVLFIKEMGDIELEFTLPLSALLSWRVVLAAVGFSLLLNLLSMLLPAWRLIRRDIVGSLNAKR